MRVVKYSTIPLESVLVQSTPSWNIIVVSVHIGILHVVVIITKKSQEESANNKSTIYRSACVCDVIDSFALTLFNEPGEVYLQNSDAMQ